MNCYNYKCQTVCVSFYIWHSFKFSVMEEINAFWKQKKFFSILFGWHLYIYSNNLEQPFCLCAAFNYPQPSKLLLGHECPQTSEKKILKNFYKMKLEFLKGTSNLLKKKFSDTSTIHGAIEKPKLLVISFSLRK